MQKVLLFGLVLIGILVTGCSGPKLAGTFDGKIYRSARKDFSVPIPVTNMGGRVVGDDERGVTFRDDMGMRVGFYSLEIKADSKVAAILQTAGKQGALREFLGFAYHGVIPLNYHPEVRGGTISLVTSTAGDRKTSAAAFIHETRVYLVEFDLPTATKHLWQGTAEEQTLWLEKRALELVETIQTN